MAVDLSGKPIAITGASSGIGLATALLCARAGMPVVLAARREDRLADAVKQITAQGGKAIAVACDVAEEADCRRVVATTVEKFGSVYAVFANAGYGIEGPVHETTDFDLRRIFEVNFWGSMSLARAALDYMIPARSGHILMCSSCVSKIGLPYFAPYSATKAAQDHFSRAMRVELAPLGVRVSSIHPIGTATEFFDTATRNSAKPAMVAHTSPWLRQSADQVAKAVVKCLRNPKGEVWTSALTRFGIGLSTIVPGLTDRALMRAARKLKY
ncbi:MAG: SDR family NAD(P)-dependent oxidoreductase [Planctomycetes bacterium]|nr:SDR family NAD(P)-dependent oxidoreductase [Planctomycetota bacterium]